MRSNVRPLCCAACLSGTREWLKSWSAAWLFPAWMKIALPLTVEIICTSPSHRSSPWTWNEIFSLQISFKKLCIVITTAAIFNIAIVSDFKNNGRCIIWYFQNNNFRIFYSNNNSYFYLWFWDPLQWQLQLHFSSTVHPSIAVYCVQIDLYM